MGGFKKGIWIARDQDGRLYAYLQKPKKARNFMGLIEFYANAADDLVIKKYVELPSSWYKNVTFENSPVFIPIPEQLVEQQIK